MDESIIMRAVSQAITSFSEHLPDRARQKVADDLHDWLATKARKRITGSTKEEREAELQRLLEIWRPALYRMAKALRIRVKEGSMVVYVESGFNDELRTFSLLLRGSSWFQPHPSLASAVLNSLA